MTFDDRIAHVAETLDTAHAMGAISSAGHRNVQRSLVAVGDELAALRARVAELEAGHLAIADALGFVDRDDTGRIGAVATADRLVEAIDDLGRYAADEAVRIREEGYADGAEAMRERAAAVLAARIVPLRAERSGLHGSSELAGQLDECIAVASECETAIRALPLDVDVGEESDHG